MIRSNVARIRRAVKNTIMALAQLYHTRSDTTDDTLSTIASNMSSPMQSESLNPSSDSDDEDDEEEDISLVKDFVMGFTEYDLLRPKLLNRYETFNVIIDLDDGYLRVRVVPGDLHGAAANAWNHTILNWANNPFPLPGVLPSLRSFGDACNTPLYLGY
jgi:hypothetical protein